MSVPIWWESLGGPEYGCPQLSLGSLFPSNRFHDLNYPHVNSPKDRSLLHSSPSGFVSEGLVCPGYLPAAVCPARRPPEGRPLPSLCFVPSLSVTQHAVPAHFQSGSSFPASSCSRLLHYSDPPLGPKPTTSVLIYTTGVLLPIFASFRNSLHHAPGLPS